MKVLRSTVALSAIAAAMLSTNASAVNIANEGIGEVAIAPFYTTREGWQSTINLINTQDRPVAVKVRFHEALNSRDVLDFTVLLSAFDVFTGVVKEGSTGRPVFVNLDQANDAGLKTCTVPNTTNASNGGGDGIEVQLSLGGFSGNDSTGVSNSDNGPETIDRLREGYIEFIVMGFADPNYGIIPGANTLALATADDITSAEYAALATTAARRNYIGRAMEDHDCATLRSAYIPTNILNTARQYGEPISALKFNFTLLNPARGTETGYSATTWANFYNPQNGSGVVTPQGFLNTLVIPEDNFNCDLDRGIERRSARTGAFAFTGTNWCPQGSSADACNVGATTRDPDTINPDLAATNVSSSASTDVTVESCRNLVTAQFPDDFLEPTLNDTFPAVAQFISDQLAAPLSIAPNATTYGNQTNAIEGTRGVDALSLTIQRATVINDWTTNPTLGVSTDWIVTQPTKAFYVDQSSAAQSQVIVAYEAAAADADLDTSVGPGDPLNGIKGRAEAFLPDTGPNTDSAYGTTGLVPYPPYAQKFAGTAPNAKSCNTIGFGVYDRAEQSGEVAPDEPVFSPSVPEAAVPNSLCYEANVISFIDSAGVLQTALGTGLNRLTVDTPNILATPQDFGWMLMSLDDFGAGDFGAAMPLSVAGASLRGLPVIGFNIRTRNFPNRPDLSFASSADHAYLRDFQ